MLLALSFASQAKAVEASWSFSPDSWDFGTLVPGKSPLPLKAFTLTNTGEVELQAVFVSVSGNEGAGFKLAGNTCGKLAPGAKCEISVTFNPSTPGPKDGQLQVASQGGLALAFAELIGTGAGPVISITPETLEFDPLELGNGPSAPKTFSIRNEGQLSLAISSILMPDVPPSSQFELVGGTCKAGVTLSPGASCTVEVTFSPNPSRWFRIICGNHRQRTWHAALCLRRGHQPRTLLVALRCCPKSLHRPSPTQPHDLATRRFSTTRLIDRRLARLQTRRWPV
jgi:hypothetical protein